MAVDSIEATPWLAMNNDVDRCVLFVLKVLLKSAKKMASQEGAMEHTLTVCCYTLTHQCLGVIAEGACTCVPYPYS